MPKFFGLAKRHGWSPRSHWEAVSSDRRWEDGIYHDLAVHRNYGPDRFRKYLDKLSTKLYKEVYGEAEAGDRAGFQMGFMQELRGVAKGNDISRVIMFGLLKAAQEAGMFDDILDLFDLRNGVPEVTDTFRRWGFDRWMFDNIKLNSYRTHVLKTLFGRDQEGLHIVNKIQDAGIKGGNYTATDVTKVYNRKTRRFEYKEWRRYHTREVKDRQGNVVEQDHMEYLLTIWIKRFQSPDAGNSMGKIRKETFGEDHVLEECMRQGFFTTRHMNYHSILQMRNCYEYLMGKMGLIWNTGYNGRLFMQSMYSSPLTDLTPLIPRGISPTSIVMNIPFLTTPGEIEISDLPRYVATAEYRKNPGQIQGIYEVMIRLKMLELRRRLNVSVRAATTNTSATAANFRAFKAAVIACPALTRPFRLEIARM